MYSYETEKSNKKINKKELLDCEYTKQINHRTNNVTSTDETNKDLSETNNL